MNEDEKTAIRDECAVAIEDIARLLLTLDDETTWEDAKDRTEEIGYRLGSIAHPSEL